MSISNSFWARALFGVTVLLGSATTSLFGQNTTTSKDDEKKKVIVDHWLGVADEIAHAYTISPEGANKPPFELHETAIFRHTQAIRGDDIGAVYLWKEPNGRVPLGKGPVSHETSYRN